MATYDELFTLAGQNVLVDRIAVAITVAADTILNEPTPTAARVVWAKSAFIDPLSQARAFQYAILAANRSVSVAAISAASDASIQANVNAAIDIFAGS